MASTTPLRRITRASMARFAYTGPDATLAKGGKENAAPDIEDIIPRARQDEEDVGPSRKRKRAAPAVSPKTRRRAVVKLEAEEDVKVTTAPDDDDGSLLPSSSSSPAPPPAPPRRAPRKPARKTRDPTTGAEAVAPPTGWEELYDAAKAMRLPGGAAAGAAVDTMGCERLAEPGASPRDRRFQTLVALMLSSQTKDTTNAAAMRRLQTELPAHAPGARPGLTLENLLAVAPERLNELIWAVGFHNNKTRYLQQAAALLRDRWGGDIPDSVEGLVSLPGVGPKMAHLCLSSAWGRTEGIGVDVHVHRITNLWGWHRTRTPEETRLALQGWLPRDRWHEINWLLVGLGQTICAPVGRKCGDCDLGLRGLCKAADRAKVNQGRKLREVKIEVKADEEDGKVVKVEEKVEEKMEEKVKEEKEEEASIQDVPTLTAKEEDDKDEPAPPTRRRGRRS